jgi:transcriptional regulator with XRE-family HTH domain
MLDRIQLIIKSKNLTASKFADEIGVQRSSISHLLSGRNKPSLELIQKTLSRFPEIRTEWLINGNGQMYKELQLFNSDVLSAEELNNQLNIKTDNEIDEAEELISDNNEDTQESYEPEYHQHSPVSSPINQSSVRSIEKIVVFYSDKTFSEYKPE